MLRLIRLSIVSWVIYRVYIGLGLPISIVLSYLVIVVEMQTISTNRLWDAFKLWRDKL